MEQDVEMEVVAAEAEHESLFDKAKRDFTALELDSDWIKLLKWIQKGMSKDAQRPTLQCFLASEDRIESTDGYIILRAKFQYSKCQIIPQGTWKIQSFMKNLVILDKIEGINYPEIQSIYPDCDPLEYATSNLSEKLKAIPEKYCRDIAFSVGFDGRYMKQIVFKPGVMRMYFGLRPPVFDLGEIEGLFGKVNLSAVVMPMSGFSGDYLVGLGPGQQFIFAESK